jgi:hypothetical protein
MSEELAWRRRGCGMHFGSRLNRFATSSREPPEATALIEPTPALLQQVRALFARLDRSVFLQSLDAVHLITAKTEHFDRLYSNDTHLLAACRSVHLKGVNPIAPPIDR